MRQHYTIGATDPALIDLAFGLDVISAGGGTEEPWSRCFQRAGGTSGAIDLHIFGLAGNEKSVLTGLVVDGTVRGVLALSGVDTAAVLGGAGFVAICRSAPVLVGMCGTSDPLTNNGATISASLPFTLGVGQAMYWGFVPEAVRKTVDAYTSPVGPRVGSFTFQRNGTVDAVLLFQPLDVNGEQRDGDDISVTAGSTLQNTYSIIGAVTLPATTTDLLITVVSGSVKVGRGGNPTAPGLTLGTKSAQAIYNQGEIFRVGLNS
ncbi:MAG TPA: hypothetical protein VHE55_11195 [Fimbriimonadaceae bacterium]|nr:hypothetical protein [Fimbriimonadaceae bacterium]